MVGEKGRGMRKDFKDSARTRWQREYINAFPEKHHIQQKSKSKDLSIGNVFMIKGRIKSTINGKLELSERLSIEKTMK